MAPTPRQGTAAKCPYGSGPLPSLQGLTGANAPGEGSTAPKATAALPGTDVNPAGRAPARLAVHCSLATGGPGAAMFHAPFGRPRLAFAKRKPSRFATYVFAKGEYVACGTLWVLSRVGKYLVRPQADETSHKKLTSCGRQGKDFPCFSLFRRGFRLCGGDQRAFRSPFGNLRGPPLGADRVCHKN